MTDNRALTILIMTRNAGKALGPCLDSVTRFPDVRVIDSDSTDDTRSIAALYRRPLVAYSWDGRYPKKRQWCLDHLPGLGDWVFFLDADERLTPGLSAEIERITAQDHSHTAYWITGRPVLDGRPLRFGRGHAKISLFRHRDWFYPPCEDLADPAIQAIGDIEGHYQPVCRTSPRIGTCRSSLLHEWCLDPAEWSTRHNRYAAWEAAFDHSTARNRMTKQPADPVHTALKALYHALPLRGCVAFIDSFIFCLGCLDGLAGWRYASLRASYGRMVQRAKAARSHA